MSQQHTGQAAIEAVILLHGLARTKFSLLQLAFALKPAYHVVNIGYPSRRFSVETLAQMAILPALERCNDAPKVHFVTHSMGGILLRQFLSARKIDNLGHVVMMGPPNQGSELVDFFLGKPRLGRLFRAINGPAGSQLGTGDDAKPAALGNIDFSLGVIAGNQSFNPVFNRIMHGEHDGKVSVERSKIVGMSDHITLPVNHTFMMQDRRVIEHVKHFLKHGKFE